ncbi:MAG TPA: hypothetical protein ENN81_06560 [Phycisphaerales bacterium]|nr:hypothetical protein [Phycisphaerales bacterium]
MKKHKADTSVKVLAGVVVMLAVVAGIVAMVRYDTTGAGGSGLGREFAYDLSELARIDPNRLLYAQAGPVIATGLQDATGICVAPDSTAYVTGDRQVVMFDAAGSRVGQFPVAGAARCIAVAQDGAIYLGMKDHVQVYDKTGKQLAAWPSAGENAVLTSLAVCKDEVFAADAGNRVVLRYGRDGRVIGRIGEKDPARNIAGFVIPSPYFDLAVADDGLLRVVNPGRHRIEAYTVDGDLEFGWGEFSSKLEGFIGCCNPVNFAILPDGDFVTCEKGLVRVKVYDAEGRFAGAVAGPEQLVEGGVSRVFTLPAGSRSGAFDVAVDPTGRVYVLDTLKNVIRIFVRKTP